MNEPIISPLYVYLIDSVAPLTVILFLISSISIFIMFVEANKVSDRPTLPKTIKFYLACLILIVSWLLPNPDTIYKMILAKQTTPENILKVKAFIKETIKDLKE